MKSWLSLPFDARLGTSEGRLSQGDNPHDPEPAGCPQNRSRPSQAEKQGSRENGAIL